MGDVVTGISPPKPAMGISAPGSSSAPLRVCLLHNYREAQQISMKVYAEQLGRALEGRGARVDRICPPSIVPPVLRRFWAMDKLDSYVGRFVEYPRIARTASADVYHIVDHGQAFLINSLDPRRTVVTCHDLMLLVAATGRMGNRLQVPMALHVFREVAAFLRQAAAVVADSESTRRDLIEQIGVSPEKIEVIPLGLNQPFAPSATLRARGRARWNLPDDAKIVLQLGHAFYKNVETCLEVVARLRARGRPVILLRARRKLSPAHVKLAKQLGVFDSIVDLGPVGDHELPMLYNAVDALLFPSRYEGFGWPPLEAMASGTPVVCSRAGALGEFAAPAALTADPEDVDHLADHLISILSDPKLAASLRARGLVHAARFDWDVTATRLMALYERVREAA